MNNKKETITTRNEYIHATGAKRGRETQCCRVLLIGSKVDVSSIDYEMLRGGGEEEVVKV